MSQLDNKYEGLYPGRQGDMGKIVYALCVLPLLSFIFLFIGFLFNSCNCCRCLGIVFAIIGAVLFLGSFVVECLCLAWGGSYNSVKANYDYYENHPDFQEYIKNYKNSKIYPGDSRTRYDNSKYLPPQFTYYTKGDVTKLYVPDSVHVCYYNNENDAINNVAKCLGSWSSSSLNSYYNEKRTRAEELEQKNKDKSFWEASKSEFNDQRDAALYGKESFFTVYPAGVTYIYGTLYLTCAYMIALNIIAIICFVLQFIINCCCKGGKDGSN